MLLYQQIRGALNAVRNISLKDPVIVTHSSGNHAQAVALAAKLTGYKAHVVMPRRTPDVKKNAVSDLGADITISDNTHQVRENEAVLVHHYNYSHAKKLLIKYSLHLEEGVYL